MTIEDRAVVARLRAATKRYGKITALGAVAMAAIGLTIGYRLPPKAAIATANVIFLPMAFVGGLLSPPALLPD